MGVSGALPLFFLQSNFERNQRELHQHFQRSCRVVRTYTFARMFSKICLIAASSAFCRYKDLPCAFHIILLSKFDTPCFRNTLYSYVVFQLSLQFSQISDTDITWLFYRLDKTHFQIGSFTLSETTADSFYICRRAISSIPSNFRSFLQFSRIEQVPFRVFFN